MARTALETAFTDHPPFSDTFDEVGYATLLPSAARTATPNPLIFSTHGGAGLILVLDVTTSASGSVTVEIAGVDRASGTTYTILQGAAKSGTGQVVMRVHPNLTASANLIAQDPLPTEVLVRVVHADSASITYSVGVHLTD